MAYNDSIDKIVSTYFSTFCRQEFEYKGKVYKPRDVYASDMLARQHKCYQGCAGCCPRFSLDYIPTETLPYEGLEEKQLFGKVYYSDPQPQGWHCKHVDSETGWCKIHGKQPFSCDFEAIRMHVFADQSKPNRISVAPFGRAWALLKVDGVRGAKCTFEPASQEGANESIRKLKRLKEWMEYFGIAHCIDEVVEWLQSGGWQHGKKVFRVEKEKTIDNF